MVHLFSSLLVLGLLPTSFAALKKFTLTVTNANIQPDGFTRSAIVVNGTFPAPTIAVNKGDSVEINLRNRLTDPTMRRSTSIHWHGFFQARTSGMDGPAMVNQCPIAPGDDFLYQFDTAGQSGNYWYHSHLSTQYCDGLRGAFVVYDPDDPLKSLYDVDDASTIITLGEWYHNPAPTDQNSFFKTGVIPVQFAGVVNGVGRFVGGPLVPYSVITVDKGKRYRFRLFSISCRPFMTFSVDNHTFDVMEFDGVEHDPVPVQNVDVYAAQRVSIILNANQTVNNYWIRAPPTGGSPANNPAYDPTLARAILRYRGAPAVEPTTTNPGGVKLDEGLMHPIAQEGPGKTGSQPPDIAINLDIEQPNAPFFDINGVSYIPPPLPILLQMLSGAVAPTDYLPSENVFVLGKNKTVEISIPGAGAHPFHLHGHAFDVIRQPNTDVVNYVNPPRRDVTAINGGNTTFRFVTDNSGSWFLHCHIDWHLEAGLAVAFAERPDEANTGPQAQIVTPGWRQLCPTYDGLAPELQ